MEIASLDRLICATRRKLAHHVLAQAEAASERARARHERRVTVYSGQLQRFERQAEQLLSASHEAGAYRRSRLSLAELAEA